MCKKGERKGIKRKVKKKTAASSNGSFGIVTEANQIVPVTLLPIHRHKKCIGFTAHVREAKKIIWVTSVPLLTINKSVTLAQWVTKTCRLSWLTNSALVFEPKRGGGSGSRPMSTAMNMEPK